MIRIIGCKQKNPNTTAIATMLGCMSTGGTPLYLLFPILYLI